MSKSYFVRETGELICMDPGTPKQEEQCISRSLGLPPYVMPEIQPCGKGFLVSLRGPAEETHFPASIL